MSNRISWTLLEISPQETSIGKSRSTSYQHVHGSGNATSRFSLLSNPDSALYIYFYDISVCISGSPLVVVDEAMSANEFFLHQTIFVHLLFLRLHEMCSNDRQEQKR